MKFDELLEEIGEFGPYQKKVYILTSLVAVAGAFQVMSVVFLLEIPDHRQFTFISQRCAIPGYVNDTFTPQNLHHGQLINLTIPMVENAQGETTQSKCKLYNVTSDDPGYNFTQYDCDAWVYDTSVMVNTVISQFNMVCSNEIFRSFGTMIAFLGATLGALFFGIIADAFGRKKTILPAIVLNVISNIAAALSQSYEVYTAAFFFSGLSGAGLFMISFVIAVEIVGPSKRTFAGMVINFFWVAGLFLLTAIAYFVRHWRHLRLVIGVPPIFFVSYWWLLPESPRWLISKGKNVEASKIIRKIAEANKTDVSDATLAILAPADEQSTVRLWRMFTTPVLIFRAFIIFFNMFAINLAYFGLTLNMSSLSGDIYLNFFLSSLMELIAYAGAWLLLYKVGRKHLLAATMLLGGTACVASIFPVLYENASTSWILIALSMVGKLGSSASFSIMAIYVTELFPTVIRESGLAATSVSGSIGGMVAPYIADLGILVEGQLTDALPLIVFGGLTVVAGLFVFLLPETRNRKLPETVKDAIDFEKKKEMHCYVVDGPVPHKAPAETTAV